MKTVLDFQRYKDNKQKISMITCYDYSFARILNASTIDVLLVGDSLAEVIYGHPNTCYATVSMMNLHTSAVSRGAPNKFIVADMPFLSTRKGKKYAIETAGNLITSGAKAVKIEGAKSNVSLITHLVESGIPVMGHLGLTPQFIHQLGGNKIQGRDEACANNIINDALLLEQAGCFSIVLECIPNTLSEKITAALTIPTIGIGAGPNTSGQVLVLQDMLGMHPVFLANFLKLYAALAEYILSSVNAYASDVSSVAFPNKEHAYD